MNGVRTYFLYAGGQLLAELDDTGTLKTSYTWGPTGLLNRTNLQTNQETWYLYDPQGNVAMRLEGSGRVLSTDQYDAWGNLISGGDTADPCGYRAKFGYYTDHETGLILCGHRYYDPVAGRWLTRDPIGYSGGLNLYAYCGNNPVTAVDPEGSKVYLMRRSVALNGVLNMDHAFLYCSNYADDTSGGYVGWGPSGIYLGLQSNYIPGKDKFLGSEELHLTAAQEDMIMNISRATDNAIKSGQSGRIGGKTFGKNLSWYPNGDPTLGEYNSWWHNCHDFIYEILNEVGATGCDLKKKRYGKEWDGNGDPRFLGSDLNENRNDWRDLGYKIDRFNKDVDSAITDASNSISDWVMN